jgi:tryptophan synthase alpha subunit
MKNIMAHVVAGYPSYDECIELMLGMQEAGVGIIEVQVPFSDPIADGETIMRANDTALANGMNTAGSFELISRARKKGLRSRIYVMSYVQKAAHFGMEEFCRAAKEAGAEGLIIPDLPYDSPEYENLARAAKKTSLQIVPVVSPGMSPQRLKGGLAGKPKLIYLTSMKGITGNRLSVSDELGRLCESARKISPDSDLAIGFGIRTKEDVVHVLKIADIAVVGSAVIREIHGSGVKNALKLIKQLASD